jgi:serine/threonine protein kinase
MEHGSLYDMLHGRRSEESYLLSFEQRLKIARDVALGLEYLHHGASPGIIHRDIKSANVLLDNRLSAKMADFGCFKQGHDNTFSINSPLETTNYRGTFGYMDPTLATSLTVSTKSDVYSFGVLVLELVTPCRPPLSSALSIVDPLIMDDHATDVASLQLLVYTAYQCLNPVRDERPSMIEVVRLLGPAEAFEDCSAPSLVVPESPNNTASISNDDKSAASSLIPLVHRNIQEVLLTHGR